MVAGFDILYGSAIGAVHLRGGKPNQDALSIHFKRNDGFFSVADGHGSDVCFRSDIGAQIAVKVAVETGVALKHKATGEVVGDEFLDIWAKSLVKAWATGVLKHLKGHPFKDEEVGALTPAHAKSLAANALLAYGSTIAACMLTDSKLYVLNLGDGDVLLKRGTHTENIQFKDTQMVGGLTYSLSTTGCLNKFEKRVMALDAIDGIMLSTDGYRNSFASESDFYKVLADIKTMHTDSGHLPLHSAFQSWLDDTSKFGSGDDITAIVLLAK